MYWLCTYLELWEDVEISETAVGKVIASRIEVKEGKRKEGSSRDERRGIE